MALEQLYRPPLSPRVRGNRRIVHTHKQRVWSIPPRAGEPEPHYRCATPARVYPRACGGTDTACVPTARRGTIRVYPRACGGTVNGTSIPARAGEPHHRTRTSLSPRVRGNLAVESNPTADSNSGSIPARAGEPKRTGRSAYGLGLSPRVRGNRDAAHVGPQGLSPRVRGNRDVAAAGWRRGLSPRVRGNRVYCNAGLSPRVRGEPVLKPASGRERLRSIPARAGEPCWGGPVSAHREGSIPARAGEPTCANHLPQLIGGLSPRVRGNRLIAGVVVLGTRSIPARAGEPLPAAYFLSMSGLSPRVRGNRV